MGVLWYFAKLFNSKSNLAEWNELTSKQPEAIPVGVRQLDEAKGRGHSLVIQDIKNKVRNA